MSRVPFSLDTLKNPLWKTTVLFFIVFVIMLRTPSVAAVRYGLNTKKGQNPVHAHTATTEFIKSACKNTLYPDVCVSSLSPYGGSLKANQTQLVQTAVEVSLLKARNASLWALGLKRRRGMNARERAALQDCIVNFGDSKDQLSGSLTELKHLRSKSFQWQMSNVQTWLSAALTDETTCLDGFQKANGVVKGLITARAQNMCKMISNALALVNKFATTGGHGLVN